MNKIVLFFLLIFLFSKNYSQEIIPSNYRNFTRSLDSEKAKGGFYLTKNSNLSYINTTSFLKVVRKLENDFSVFFSDGFSVDESKMDVIYNLKEGWNYSAALTNILKSGRYLPAEIKVSVKVVNASVFKSKLTVNIPEAKILYRYRTNFIITLPTNDITGLNSDLQVYYLDVYQKASTETPVNANDISVNRINAVQNNYPRLNGSGLAVSVKEFLFDATDIDFKNRYFFTGLEAAQLDQHASAMATVIGGAGNSSEKGRGVATAVQLTSSSFLRLLPDNDANFSDNNIYVQNHSYGTIVENEYGNEAAAYDEQSADLSGVLHVFSSGNRGTDTPQTGPYAGITGYANQTGNFKMAKNIITVGAVSVNGEVDARSSKGPAYDGRVKPELVSYAPGGTSDASALVSGVTALLQQLYKEQNDNNLPNSALLKATFIAGAKDIGPPAVDYQSGYGNMDALRSIRILESNNYAEGILSQDETVVFNITIPDATKNIRIALSWIDPAANPGDTQALVNDLDMELISPDANVVLPWVLNSFPHIDSITKPAIRAKDHLNTNELISLENPAPGTYSLQITGTSVSDMAQAFSIAYYIEEENLFEWIYPTKNDGIENKTGIVRWNNSFTQQTGQLELNINDTGWQSVNALIDLETEAQEIDFSGINGRAQLRMLIGNDIFLSEEFGISPQILPDVLYDCDTEIALGWNRIPNASSYILNNLGDTYMEVRQTTSDTLVILPKNTFNNPYFSVTPVFNGTNGIQGRTFNYEHQRVNCYYINFFAFLNEENAVDATLNLSTTLNVDSVTFQKLNKGINTDIQFIEAPFNNLRITVIDSEPDSGTNAYYATIKLSDGTTIITEAVDIFIPTPKTLIVYPNPFTNESDLTVVSSGFGRDLEIVDLMGRVVFHTEVSFISERFNLNLIPGIYIVRLVEFGETINAKKLIVN